MRKQRVFPVFCVLMLGFVIVGARLVKLQVWERAMWLRESERSTVRFQSRPSQRGFILDRHGEPLAHTEDVRDLMFRYRGWRRLTVAGQASHAWVTLGMDRVGVEEAVEGAGDLLRALAEVTVDQVCALPVRQQRRDMGFYLERLFGSETWEAIAAALREPDVPHPELLASLPGFEAGLARALDRLESEREALHVLGRVTGLSHEQLLAGMQRAVTRADRRVAVGLEKNPGDERSEYRRRQQLHAQYDSDGARLASHVPYDTRTLLALRSEQLGGFQINIEKRRIYPEESREVAPLIVGRVALPLPADMEVSDRHRLELADLSSLSWLSAEELDRFERLRIQVREVDYAPGEERGVFGVEAALEEVLRGKRGWESRTDHVDRQTIESEDPRRGLNVVLTLDIELQRACQEVLDEFYRDPPLVLDAEGEPIPGQPEHWSGAIVLLDPRTGHVLALASGPRPTRQQLTDDFDWLSNEDPLVQIRHRAVDPGRSDDLPPPGSVFKPVSALAGLTAAEPRLTAATTFLCEGKLDVGDRSIGCLGTHGEIGLHEAIARSCNIYFYRLGRSVGVDALSDMARRFGFGRGERSGLLLGNEVLASLGVPVASGFHESQPRLGKCSTVTHAMMLAIGQAPLDDVTPLQVATMMGAIATGRLQPPSLVAAIEGYPSFPQREAQDLGLPRAALQEVRMGMAQVVDSPVGTGRKLNKVLEERMPWMLNSLACKTGTAQVGDGADQSWFAGFAPRDEPRLAFAVLVEDCGLHGSEAALPMFERLLEKPAMAEFLRHEVLMLPPVVR